ncbi:TetR/AcrR family transcriptional regulator [Mycobacterium sp. 1245805.9]|uniref:TetR/AcrR family transcriptional regulator n=1 Tax=Mycobacterium sp. 1245805.9 TaxID=1856862 RepID=UPI0007FC85C0|nr:TetR/AcrR family transcriptional regulator [Mycobacterium sp. 1245805.9]OBI94153.1 TetR family transcriptional regulator [Mycobacterium sp. 1245805.9]
MSEPARGGRPRSAAVHDAILDAVRQTLIEGGYAEVAMDRVAARAGVGKQSVYRRWPSKAPMVAEAVLDAYRSGASFALPDTGDIDADLRTWLRGYAQFIASASNAALLRALLAAAAEDKQDGETLYRQLTEPQYHAVLDRFRNAVQTSAIRADADFESLAQALIGAPVYRVLAHLEADAATSQQFDGLVEVIMRGLHRD